MHQSTLICVAPAIIAVAAVAQKPIVNYDESKVGTYTLPDPLVMSSGAPVGDARNRRVQAREC